MKKKIISIVGTRPQFIKCALLSHELRKRHGEILVHTGQHYDLEMSEIFFEELNIPKPGYNLEIGSGHHGEQTGKMIIEIENILIKENAELVLVYGDTNSTLAGAIAASKLQIKVAHVEAGLRSFDKKMPEEINRITTDHVSSLLLCPTQTAVNNLAKEGITDGVYLVGDVMLDVLEHNRKIAEEKSGIIETLGIEKGKYLVVTIHRPSNTDVKKNMVSILDAISELCKIVVFPVHPRTRNCLHEYGLWYNMPPNIKLIEPVGYLDMLALITGSEKILTDSGGLQKEAYMLRIPCITLRENTEWVETLVNGWNVLSGSDKNKIIEAERKKKPIGFQPKIFGNIGAYKRILNILEDID